MACRATFIDAIVVFADVAIVRTIYPAALAMMGTSYSTTHDNYHGLISHFAAQCYTKTLFAQYQLYLQYQL